MNRAQWLALAERCEKAKGPDRELDEDIAQALGWTTFMFGGAGLCWKDTAGEPRPTPPRWTSSLDAIVALIDVWLPRWRVRWQTDGDGVHEAFLENKGDFGAVEARHTLSFGINPALALCAAFCRAMAERAGQ